MHLARLSVHVETDVSVLMQALLVTMHTPPLVKEFYPWNEIRNFTFFTIQKLHTI